MEQIQATVTITLTKEQLLQLLIGNSPEVVIVPAPVQQAPAPAPAPAPMPVQQTPPANNVTNAGAYTTPPVNNGRDVTAGAPRIPVQTAPQTYSVQDLMLAARPLAENGKKQELLALLAEFGVPAVTNIPEDRRADFAARLRAIGGQI